MVSRYIILVLLLAVGAAQVESAKILGLFWTPSRSHHIAGASLLQALARKGHDVDLYSSFNDKVYIPTYKQTLLTGIIGSLDNNRVDSVKIGKMFGFVSAINDNVEKFWKNEPIQKLIETKPKYDVVITLTFFNDYVLALSHFLETPVIMFSPVGANPMINKLVGNPNLPYAKHLILDKEMDTFLGRLSSTTLNMVTGVVEKYVMEPLQNEINKKYLPNAPKVEVLIKNVSLLLVNSHYVIEAPRPYVPNMVQIGGFVTQQVNKLPEDLQTYLDSSKNGAILFSMGTNVEIATYFEKEKLETILKGLEKVAPMKVLFKSEIDLPNVPKNVKVMKWILQNDVLAHSNIKLFISHGGLGGTTEAVFHGVPMLGIPFFADQKTNIASAVACGLAIKLEIAQLTQETFDEALNKLLTNTTYAKNAKKRSSILRDQQIKPLENAIWWVEHIIEHKGGEHLRNVAINLEWYQLYMVDIMGFYLVVICISLTATLFITRWILRRICKIFKGCEKKLDKEKKN